jgi:hypothetical protein
VPWGSGNSLFVVSDGEENTPVFSSGQEPFIDRSVRHTDSGERGLLSLTGLSIHDTMVRELAIVNSPSPSMAAASPRNNRTHRSV